MKSIVKLSEYRDWLHDLKQHIRTGQVKAALSVNSQMILLYWDLGRQIAEKQEQARWGSGFIEQLSRDLREEFPEMAGFSRTNLFRMKMFYQFYSRTHIAQCNEIVPQPVGQLENNDNEIVAQAVQQREHGKQRLEFPPPPPNLSKKVQTGCLPTVEQTKRRRR